MKRYLATLCALFSALVIGGCATQPKPPSLAIAIVSPASQPSAEQLATIHRLLQPHIANKGFVPARDARSADYVMHVRFTPDPFNPPRGHLELIGIERNRPSNLGRPDNAATAASASTLAELRQTIAEIDAVNARSN
ncbi:MAG: hypothetical protein V4773_19945 [Verrucomicrobiota bacterium]